MNENIALAILAELKRLADAVEVIAGCAIEHNAMMEDDIMDIQSMQQEDEEMLMNMIVSGESN